MRIIDVMVKDVITVKKDTPVGDAQKLMRERKIRRLPVIDNDGKPIGVITIDRLENIRPPSGTPLLWQISYLMSHTTVGDVMRKDLVTVTPMDSVEYAIARAQAAKVGTVIVVENEKIVGICATNDFFYGIANPLLGISERGSRIIVIGGGDGKPAEAIIGNINKAGIKIKVIWGITSPTIQKNNLVLHLETEDPTQIVEELKKKGYDARIVQR